MLTTLDQLFHYIDCASCDDAQKRALRAMVRGLDDKTATALEAMISEIADELEQGV